MGAEWEFLPDEIRNKMITASTKLVLRDQIFSNIIYGLSLMNVRWANLNAVFRQSLLHAMSLSSTFESKVAQHVSNTIWVHTP